MWGNNKSKYKAQKTTHKGYSFASKGEANCFDMLTLLEKAGEIKILQLQPQVHLTLARILYKPDFKILDIKLNQEVYCEFKGFETSEWKIKKRLWEYYGPALLRVYRSRGNRIVLTEEVKPDNGDMTNE